MDDGPETITEAAEAAAVRSQARKVQRTSVVAALAATAIGWLLS